MNDGKGYTALARRLYHHVVHEGPLICPKEDLSAMVKGMEEKDQQISDLQDLNRELLEALERAVTIAEDQRPGTWDDLLQYRALIAKAYGGN